MLQDLRIILNLSNVPVDSVKSMQEVEGIDFSKAINIDVIPNFKSLAIININEIGSFFTFLCTNFQYNKVKHLSDIEIFEHFIKETQKLDKLSIK